MKISKPEYDKISGQAIKGHPDEICGLLIGSVVNGNERVVKATFQARNTNNERAHDRFELHPDDYLSADKFARDNKMEIVGVYHTHPDSPARPSKYDRERAWEGFSYLIIRVDKDKITEAKSWFLKDQDSEFDEEPFVVE